MSTAQFAATEDEQRRKLRTASHRRAVRRWRLLGFPFTLLALGALAAVVLHVAMGGLG